MDFESYDVLVVGGGLAGIRAAIAVVETNPRLKVGMVSKVYPMRSHTVSAEGGAAAVLRPEDSYENHAFDTIKGSDYLADQDVVEAFVREAPIELIQMEHWGCPWSRDPDGKISARPFGGMTTWRTCFAADKTGFHMLHTVFQTSLKYPQIHRHDEAFVTKLLVEDGRCVGVVAIDMRSGRFDAITAKAVILATGGLGRVYAFTTNGNICTGDGMALAYRAGVGLKDMEMVQFHPTGLPFTGILITEAVRGEGGYLLNKDGERFLKRYVPEQDGARTARHHLAGHDHRVRGGPRLRGAARPVHAPRRQAPRRGDHRPQAALHARARPRVRRHRHRPRPDPGAARAALHDGRRRRRHLGRHSDAGSLRGGRVRQRRPERRQSPGLELAVGMPGLRRRRGPHGRRVRRARRKPVGANPIDAMLRDETRRIEMDYLDKKSGDESIGAIREEMQHDMDAGAGVFRTREGLEKLTKQLGNLRDRFGGSRSKTRAAPSTPSSWRRWSSTTCSRCPRSSPTRRSRARNRAAPTRGATFPERNDEKYLKHTIAMHANEIAPRLEYRDVRITNFKPQARAY